jgi:tetratricopeptide (TPR) repeat protein
MSDVGPRSKKAPARSAPKRASGLLESGIFRDPLVRGMTYVALGIVVLFLATVVGALSTGVFSPTGPRTAAERELMIAAATVQAQGAKGEAWAPYINALVAAGDLGPARVALGQARASVPGTAPVPGIDLAEARLLTAEGRDADAADAAGTAMKGYKAEFDAKVAKSKSATTQTVRPMLAADYYNAALVKAYAYVALRKFGDAVPLFDIYIKVYPTSSDILVDRGNAKAELKDKAGAEKDFREALRFVPYDEEAKAGLKRIGVAQ